MEQYSTFCVIDADVLRQAKKHMLTFSQKAFYGIAALVFVASLGRSFFRRNTVQNDVICIVGICYVLYKYHTLTNEWPDAVQSSMEKHGVDAFEYTNSCTGEGVLSVNRTTDKSVVIPYSDFSRIAHIDEYYLLFTASRQVVLFHRGELEVAGEIEQFMAYLGKQCPKMIYGRKAKAG